MEQNPWEIYGMTEAEWNALADSEKQAYLNVGQEENLSEQAPEEAK